jgi:5'(3')-deoxyribonucleotidase
MERVDGIDEKMLAAIIRKLLDGDYVQPLKPFKGAAAALKRLGEIYSPVLFVTARPYVGPIQDWIPETLGLDAAKVKIIATGSFEGKTDILLDRRIAYFVEDRLETCYFLEAAGITPILFKQPWNRENRTFLEVGSWEELEALIAYQ